MLLQRALLAKLLNDEHDWTTDETPQAHLEHIKAALPKKLSLFHASLVEDMLVGKIQEAGSFLAFTRDLVTVIKDMMLSYVHLQLLAQGHHNVKRVTETKIIPILILSCLSKTDSPAETRQKLHDRFADITANDFAMIEPLSTLPAEWTDAAIIALATERSNYGTFIRSLALRESGPRSGVTVGKSALKRLFSGSVKPNTSKAPTAASLGRTRPTATIAKVPATSTSGGTLGKIRANPSTTTSLEKAHKLNDRDMTPASAEKSKARSTSIVQKAKNKAHKAVMKKAI